MNDHDLQRQWRHELAKWGAENVRIALSNQTYIPNIDREFAWEWLREQDETRLLLDRRYARWTLGITVVAAVAGVIAAVASILALLR
jgi:hypothetical protein